MATISGDGTENVLSGTNSADCISGGSGDDTLSGGNGNDLLLGGSGDDVIDGGNGNDLIFGGSGEDEIYGGNGSDLIFGGSGEDEIYGGNGSDLLFGGSGDDTIDGGNGNDVISGDWGDDVLIGVGGADWLMGGAGSDVFAYLNASDSNGAGWDRIIDFTQGKDKIDLSELLGKTTDLAWGDKTGGKHTAWYQNFGSSTVVFADVNGDGKADLQIELKNTSGLKLTSSDFIGVGSELVATDNRGTALESGVAAGSDAKGNVLTDGVADSDAGNGATLTVSAIRTGTEAGSGKAGVVGSSLAGAYGTLTLFSDGNYSYTVDNSNATVNALNTGGSVTDTFTYTVSNAAGGTDTAQLTVTINGTNDAAVLSSATMVLDETDAPLTTGGTLTNDDVDSAETFVAQTDTAGTYGKFSIDADGAWTYTADSAHNEFATGITYTDSFDVTSADGTQSSVQVTINGTNDAAVITGTVMDTDVTEAGGVLNGTPGDAMASGFLVATDVDSSAAFVVQTNVAKTYGTFSIDDSGAWGYTLDDNNADVQALNTSNTPLHDLITVTTADGTEQVIDVTINGTNDAAVITGTVMDTDVTEAGGVLNGTPGDAMASGNLVVTDVDSSAAFVVQTNVAKTYGTFSIDDSGAWGYTLDDDNLEVQKLNTSSDPLHDLITVATADGTTHQVDVTINGADDLLFDENDNIVNFNAVSKGIYVAEKQYDALDGDDTVTLPNDEQASKLGFDITRTFFGGDGDDTITATGNLDNRIDGGTGNDTISGSAGNDTLAGGTGHDTVNGDSGDDRITMLVTTGDVDAIHAGSGNDTLALSGVVPETDPGDHTMVVDLSSTTDQVVRIGGALEDGLKQTDFENLDASGLEGTVNATGSSGTNTIVGSDGSDRLDGGAGDDFLFGGAGDDTLFGGPGGALDGKNVLVGGAGDDFMVGGGGDDIFDYNALSDAGPAGDIIQLFNQQGTDLLDLHELLISIGAPQPDSAEFSGYLRLTDDSYGTSFVEVDSDGGGNSFQLLATVVTEVPLTFDDFIL